MSENVNRLTYANWPLDLANDDVSLGLAALSQVVPSGVVATLTVPSTAAFLQTHHFSIMVGLRDPTTTIPSNRENFRVAVFDATTLTVISRSDSSRTHAVGEIVAPDFTADDARNNPGPMTATGSIPYLALSGNPAELLAGADRTFVVYDSGLPIVRAIQAADIPDLSASYATPGSVISYVSGAYVPLTRTVNGHALSADVTVSATDLGTGTLPLGRLAALTTTQFASAAVSQWANDASYTTLSAVAGVGYLTSVVSAPKWTTARNLAGNSVDGSASVAFANKFIVQGTTDTGLSAAQFLGALGTGLVKNTTSTGVLSIAVAADIPDLSATYSLLAGNASLVTVGTITAGVWSGTAIAANKGGTGLTSFAVGDLIYAPTTSSLGKLADVATGSVLVSGGVSGAPAWSASPTLTGTVSVIAPKTGGVGIVVGDSSPVAVGAITIDMHDVQSYTPWEMGSSLALVNRTPAVPSPGVQLQNPPPIYWRGESCYDVDGVSRHYELMLELNPSQSVGGRGQQKWYFCDNGDLSDPSRFTNDPLLPQPAMRLTSAGILEIKGAMFTAGLFSTGDLSAGAAKYLYWDTRTQVNSPANGQITIANNAVTAGIGFDVTTDGLLKVRTRAQDAYGNIQVAALTATTLNGNTFTAGTYTLTGAAGKTLTFNNSITLAGTDARTYTFPTTSATLARTDAANTFTGHQTIEGVTSTGATGTGNLVFDTAPTFASNVTVTSYIVAPGGFYHAASGGLSSGYDFDGSNPTHFVLTTTGSNPQLQFKDTNAVISRAAAATFQFGLDVNGPAVSQIIQAANGITGTDKTGGNLTNRPGLGTGSGTPAAYIVQTSTALGSGTTAQSYTTRLTISGAAITTALPVLMGANYHELTEMTAPSAGAADTVRIYAVDNGGGKTQLMALFASGAAQQIAIQL